MPHGPTRFYPPALANVALSRLKSIATSTRRVNMGSSRWSSSDWDSHVSHTASKPASAIFSHGMHPDLDPKNIVIRESVDSPANPNSTPIIVAVDVTGSMGILATVLVK